MSGLSTLHVPSSNQNENAEMSISSNHSEVSMSGRRKKKHSKTDDLDGKNEHVLHFKIPSRHELLCEQP